MATVLELNRILAHHADITGKSFVVVETNHDSASSLRVRDEFAILGEGAVNAILKNNSAFIECDSAHEATEIFENLDLAFPAPDRTCISMDAALIRPFLPVARFTQTHGFEGRRCENFTSNAVF